MSKVVIPVVTSLLALGLGVYIGQRLPKHVSNEPQTKYRNTMTRSAALDYGPGLDVAERILHSMQDNLRNEDFGKFRLDAEFFVGNYDQLLANLELGTFKQDSLDTEPVDLRALRQTIYSVVLALRYYVQHRPTRDKGLVVLVPILDTLEKQIMEADYRLGLGTR